MRILISTAIVLGVAALAPATAFSQSSYQPYVLGLRSAGMGGTAVAFGHDSAAPWLNPAGVAKEGGILAMSANAGLLRTENTPDYFSVSPGSENIPTGGIDTDRTSSVFSVFPTSVLYTLPFGDHVVGLTIVSPFHAAITEFTNFVVDRGTGPSIVDLYTRQIEVATNSFGLVYAYDFGFGSAGLSAYVSYTTFRLSFDNQFLNYAIALNRLNFFPRTTTDDAESIDFDVIAGVQIGPFHGFSAGITTQLPSIHLSGDWDSSSTVYLASNIDPDDVEIEVTDSQIRDGDYRFRFPETFRIGVGYEIPKTFAIAVDVSIHLPISEFNQFEGVERRRVLSNDPNAVNQLPPDRQLNITRTQELVINTNVGVELYVNDRIPIRAGFFTDLSNQPELPPPGERGPGDVNSSRIDRFGATLGVGYEGELTSFQLAFAFLGGVGKIIGIEYDFTDGLSQRFVDVDTAINSFMVVFSGELDPSAIADAALQAVQEEATIEEPALPDPMIEQ